MVENRISKLKSQIQKTQDEQSKLELVVMEKCKAALENEQPLRTVHLQSNEEYAIRGYQMLTLKPLLVVLNIGEEDFGRREEIVKDLQEKFPDSEMVFDSFSGKIEMELAQLSDEDAELFMGEYGIEESALNRIIGSAYAMLGLISFLTFGDDECRAWPLRNGTHAHEAAGVIHTDLMNRFIRAEVVHFGDFVKHGSIHACKEHGAWRLEGKDYIVQDGDMITIRHG
jgi:ribosome-binding ATPase YchF (GTP1/OBG family)